MCLLLNGALCEGMARLSWTVWLVTHRDVVRNKSIVSVTLRRHTFVTVVLVVAAAVEECGACDAGTVTVTFGISDSCTPRNQSINQSIN